MGKNVEHIQHIKSNVVLENGKPKLPQSGTLVEGELAVNYAKDVETISLENASGEVVTFSSDKYYTEQKLGSAFTGANSAVTVTDVIEENEEIISSALNDLETRKLDSSAYTESLWEAGTGLNSVVLKGSSGTASGDYSLAEGYSFEYDGDTYASIASGSYSHTEGVGTSASSMYSHAEGVLTTASGPAAHAEGLQTLASGESSHAEGAGTSATSYFSHAEGADTIASGISSHAEGTGTTASGRYSHAEGTGTTASGESSHAEGYNTLASGSVSHAEGLSTEAIGEGSHAEGNDTKASGDCSHAEGSLTVSNGLFSHAEGEMTITSNRAEHANGFYNISLSEVPSATGHSGNTLFSVGNGDYETRHNAFEIRQNGDIYITSGGTASSESIKLQDYLGGGGGTIDQVLDDTTSASTNSVSSKAVYKAVTDNELVWTNAYVTLSGTVSAHTIDTNIHITSADRAKLDSITGTFGTMAYEDKTSYSSATEVNTALGNKAETTALTQVNNTLTAHTADTTIHVTATDKTAWNAKVDASAIADFFDDAKYEDSGTTKVINFYHGNTIKATIDASDFIVDGMVDDVRIENGNLVIDFNTASGKQDISIPLTDIFDPSNYYNKTAIDNLVGSGFTSSSITDVIIDNEQIVSAALTDLDERKLDASAYTPTEELWVSGTGLNSVVLNGSSGTASGDYAIAEGYMTTSSGMVSHAEGGVTIAGGQCSHAEGIQTKAFGNFGSHAEGRGTIASGESSHAEGRSTGAVGVGSHSEGEETVASGVSSHAEGNMTHAMGNTSHAEGSATFAYGDYAHAEGVTTSAYGVASHTEGYGTKTSNYYEHASGQWNVSNSATTEFGDSGNTLFSVGNGTADNARHNAFEIRQNGDIYIVSGGTDIKLQDNIGKVDVISAITPSNSGSTAPIATKVVAENELTVSNALNNLNTNKLDASAMTEVESAISDLESIVGSGYTNTTITEVIENMDTAIAAALTDLEDNKADSAITFTAGTGLSGGGDLSSNRTFSLAMPTTYSAETYTSSTITSSEPVVYALVRYTGTTALANQVCPVTLADGQQCNVIYQSANNNAYDAVISTDYVEPDGQAITLNVLAGGYAEINYINIKGIIFVRGI